MIRSSYERDLVTSAIAKLYLNGITTQIRNGVVEWHCGVNNASRMQAISLIVPHQMFFMQLYGIRIPV